MDKRLNDNLDMATLFFGEIFGNDIAPRVMSGIIAFSIFGNIVVMTFTASRGTCCFQFSVDLKTYNLSSYPVKQEIAKEGVLPFSQFFAGSTTTPWDRLMQWIWPSKDLAYQPEQSPAAALFLHWMWSMVLIASTSPLIPTVAYAVLVPLYAYTVVVLVAFFVASGLLYLRYFSDERHTWASRAGFKPWGGPTAAIIYTAVSAYLLVANFIPPTSSSPFAKAKTGVEWYVVPTVGWGMLLLGLVYYLVFKHVYPRYFQDGKVLAVDREAVIVYEDGEYVQALEIVEFSWEAKSGPGSNWAGRNEMEVQTVNVISK